MHGRPYEGQRYYPKKDEAHKIPGVSARGQRHGICFVVQDIRLRRTKSSLNSRMLLTLGQIARSITKTHEPPILDCTPYHILQRSEYSTAQKTSYLPCHRRSVEYTPQTSKYSEAGTVDDREGYMEYSTRSTRQNDKRRHYTITDPDDQPGLPPRHAENNHARGYHPTIRELV